MTQPIENYALIGNLRCAALVARNGSIDWWCVPEFDAPACFAALLGTREHGRWIVAPRGRARRIERRYRDGTLVLETEFHNDEGTVRVVDAMAIFDGRTDIVRVVEGLRGRVAMHLELILRFGYGAVVPWVRRIDGSLTATAGPDTVVLRTPVETKGVRFTTVADFSIARGERIGFVLTHYPSHLAPPVPIDAAAAVSATERFWRAWSDQSSYRGKWREEVGRSLTTLKALTCAPTGGIVAAPTTSLPESIGGTRNWDYRYCWVRDATFTLYALLVAGYRAEAAQWREWLLRAAAGRPQDLQTLYAISGQRQLDEFVVPWLPGYRQSQPVRIGNAASMQLQLDVYGELIDTLCIARAADLAGQDDSWPFQRALVDFLESNWESPDNGIWEIRGEPQQLTHSKVMAWVALDRAIRAVERERLPGPVERWRASRDRIHATVCEKGYNARRGVFVQRFGASDLDASLLLIPAVGFLAPNDERVERTVRAIERDLVVDGFVRRYNTRRTVDGLPPGEGVFLPCSFWLADALSLMGRTREALTLFQRLLRLGNDVGLLPEEYDPSARRFLGNFPQALTHVALVNTARNLSAAGGPSEHRSRGAHASTRELEEHSDPTATRPEPLRAKRASRLVQPDSNASILPGTERSRRAKRRG